MIIETAVAAAAILAPYMPALVEAGGKTAASLVVEKGGQAAWQQAQTIWAKLKARFGDDPEVTSAATMVAAKPEDETRQSILGEVLSARLEENPELAREISELLGGRQGVQRVVAERRSLVEDVKQKLRGAGEQTIQASDEST